MAAPAAAEVEGPCTASFNGYHFDELDTPAEAKERLVIQPGETVTFYAAVPDTDIVYVDILFPPLSIPLVEFEADEPSGQGSDINEVEGELDLGAFAEYGAGIFQFVGRTDDCRGNAYFIIGGIDPWETAAGKTAIGIAGVGVLIGLTSWIPAAAAGGGGIVRSAIAGGPIGLGVAVLVQQAGMIPLSAASVSVAVEAPQPDKIYVDDATLLGDQPTPVPDATLTPQPPETPTPDAISTEAPTGSPSTTPPTTPAGTPQGPATAPAAGGTPPASPGVQPGTTAPPSPGTPATAPTPPASTPTPGAGATGAGTGPNMGLAASAVAGAGVLGVASRAAAAQKRATAGGGASDPHWFYVLAPTDVYDIDDYTTVIGRLQPGNWYAARATYDEWIHTVDQTTGAEGWVARHSVRRQGP